MKFFLIALLPLFKENKNTHVTVKPITKGKVKWIKIQRLRWLGLVQRMSDGSIPKKLWETRPEWKRSLEGEGKRWIDEVQRDLGV